VLADLSKGRKNTEGHATERSCHIETLSTKGEKKGGEAQEGGFHLIEEKETHGRKGFFGSFLEKKGDRGEWGRVFIKTSFFFLGKRRRRLKKKKGR